MPPPTNQPGRGLLGWLGRQVGYVRAAIKSDATESKPADQPVQQIFERRQVEESAHPDDPRITLRRTTIDEAIVEPDPNKSP